MSIGEQDGEDFNIWFRNPRAFPTASAVPTARAEVEKLRGSVPIAYTLAEKGANRLWSR